METGAIGRPANITEDEAALYDRQIRLWGLDAQKRMRNASILVLTLKGVATEVIKNVVLSGIGRLIIADGAEVQDEDLGAGFFFRDEDVGKKRVDVAKARVEALNPLVIVETIANATALLPEALEKTIQTIDLVCVTDCGRELLLRYNEVCRRHGKPFYCGGSYGTLGYIFCDLISHCYANPSRIQQKEFTTMVNYTPLREALKYKWKTLTKRQTKELNPSAIFSMLALWEYENTHGVLPSGVESGLSLEATMNTLLVDAEVNKQVLDKVNSTSIQELATMASHEFSPVCAIVGGTLGQDILKTLSARDAPIANFFAFDGNTGLGTVCRMGME